MTFTEGMVWMTCRICCPPTPCAEARIEPGDARTAGRVVLVLMAHVTGAGLIGVATIGSEGRGLLSDRSTGSVWSASAVWVLMMQRGGGEDFSFRSVGSGQSSSGSCFCRARERKRGQERKKVKCENSKTKQNRNRTEKSRRDGR